jgi:hypothetical protein
VTSDSPDFAVQTGGAFDCISGKTTLLVAGTNQYVYTSWDSGETWKQRGTNQLWSSKAGYPWRHRPTARSSSAHAMGGVSGPVVEQVGVGTQRQAIEAAAAWGFRAVALEVQRRDRRLHFKCNRHRPVRGPSAVFWRNSGVSLRIARLRARGTGPALRGSRTHATPDIHSARNRAPGRCPDGLSRDRPVL